MSPGKVALLVTERKTLTNGLATQTCPSCSEKSTSYSPCRVQPTFIDSTHWTYCSLLSSCDRPRRLFQASHFARSRNSNKEGFFTLQSPTVACLYNEYNWSKIVRPYWYHHSPSGKNSVRASNFFSVLIDTFSDREFMYSYAISNWSMVNVDVESIDSDQIRPPSFFCFILSLLI